MALRPIGMAVLLVTIATPSVSLAQEYPAANVSLSYSVLKDKDVNDVFTFGWLAAGGGALTRWFELVGEVGGNDVSQEIPEIGLTVDISVTSFMGGARFVARPDERVSAFVQTLAGGARLAADIGECLGLPADYCEAAREADTSRTFFALQPGGGVDIAITRRVGVRVQGDYRAIFPSGGRYSNDDTMHEFRFAAGVVVSFGSRR